jgi:hypothetical protein
MPAEARRVLVTLMTRVVLASKESQSVRGTGVIRHRFANIAEVYLLLVLDEQSSRCGVRASHVSEHGL